MPTELWALAQQVGAAGAVLLLIALWAGRLGAWAWGREVTEANKRTADCEERWKARYDAAVSEWKERLRAEAEDYEARIDELRDSNKRWETLALNAHGIAETTAHALEKAVK